MNPDQVRPRALRIAKYAFAVTAFIVAGSCSAEEASFDRFDEPFEESTASGYYQALYDAALTQTDGGLRLVDQLAGGVVVDVDTHSIFTAREGNAGLFLGDNYQVGARSKLLRWWDYYGEKPWNPDNSVALAISLVDFDSRDSAVAGAKKEIARIAETVEVQDSPTGLMLWGTSSDDQASTWLFWVGQERSAVLFISCQRFGTFAEQPGCERRSMVELRDEIARRIATVKKSSNPSGDFGPAAIPDGWKPLVAYQFDADQTARSYLDPDRSYLRASWEGSKPPSGTYRFSGYSSSYASSADNGGGPGLQLRIDQIPIKESAPALKLSETLCMDPSGAPSAFCGDEKTVTLTGGVIGGRTSLGYWDVETRTVESVRGHLVTAKYFLDFHCGHPLIYEDAGLSAAETDLCRNAIVEFAKRIGS